MYKNPRSSGYGRTGFWFDSSIFCSPCHLTVFPYTCKKIIVIKKAFIMTDQQRPLIAVLGAGCVKENGVWRTTNFGESDGFGGLEDRLRVVAGAELYKRSRAKGATVFALGGRGKLSHIPDMPTLASVVRQELIALGVPESAIRTEEESGTTLEQLSVI